MQGQEWFVYYQVTHKNGIVENKDVVWITDFGVRGSIALVGFKDHTADDLGLTKDKILVKSFNKI